MPLDSIKERHFLILGGSSGMGYAAAAYLLHGKAVVTIGGRNTTRLSTAHKGDIRPDGEKLLAQRARQLR